MRSQKILPVCLVGLSIAWSGCNSSSDSVSIDPATLVPAPSLTLISPSSTSGYSSSLVLQITWSGMSGGKLSLYGDTSCGDLGGTLDVPVGAFGVQLTLNLAHAGTFGFSAKYYDASKGTTSGCSTQNVSYTLLPTPAPTSLTLSTPSSSPGYSPNVTVLVGGTVSGQTIKVFSDSNCQTQLGSNTAYGTSTYVSFTLSGPGSYQFYANGTSGSQVSSCSTASASYTYLAPPVPTTLSLISPASSPGTPGRPTIRISGVASGVTANLYTDSGCTTKVASASAYAATADLSSGYWSTTLVPGAYTFYANTSYGSTFSACSSGSVAYTMTTLAAPSGLALVTPASSPSHYQTPVVSVSGVSSGQTVKLFSDSSCATQVGTASASGTSVDVQVSTLLPTGASALYAKVSDSSYGVSLCSTATLSYTVTPKVSLPAAQSFATDYYPRGVAIGDVNSDGALDLLAGMYQGSVLDLLLANGATYNLGHSTPGPGDYTGATVAGDFNADGKLDVALSRAFNTQVIVMLGNGNGTFATPVSYTTDATTSSGYPDGLVSADFNNDGKPDLAIANGVFSSKIGVLIGNGDGTFQAVVNYAANNHPQSIAAGDVSGDGIADLVVANTYTGTVSVFINDGLGAFAAKIDYTTAGSQVTGLALGDLNGDTKADIVASDGNSGSFSTLLNTGAGAFASATATSIPLAGRASAITLGDVDGDLKNDAVVVDQTNSRALIYFGAGDGSYDLPQAAGVAAGPNSIQLKDLNANGSLDLVTSSNNSGSAIDVIKR